LLFLLAGTTSCIEDVINTSIGEEEFAGVWHLDTYQEEFIREFTATAVQKRSMVVDSNSVVMTFSDDGSWTSEGEYYVTLDDGDEKREEVRTGGIGSGTWSIDDGLLILSGMDRMDEDDDDVLRVTAVSYSANSRLYGIDRTKLKIRDPFSGFRINLEHKTELRLLR